MTVSPLGRILLVDDEAGLLAFLQEKLTDQGYEVVSCAESREALQILQDQSFDILLTDLTLTGMDGIALVRAALELDPHLAGIVMTGQPNVPTAVEAIQHGALDYVLKPFKIPVLLTILARALEVRRLRQENLQLREAATIDELCKAIAFTTDLGTILGKIVSGALKQCEAEEASVMLPSEDGTDFCIRAIRGEGREALLGECVPANQGIAGWVARTLEPVTFDGEVHDPRFQPLHPRTDIRSSICMPMLVGGRLIGILNVNSINRRRPYSLGQVKALGILASAGAAAIDAAAMLSRLRKSEGRYRSIFEFAREGICRTTLAGDILTINPAYARMLGYDSPEEFLAEAPNAEVFYANASDRQLLWERLHEQGAVQGFETCLVARTGRAFWASINGWLVRDVNGSDVLDCTIVDISERKQTEDSLRLFRELLDRSSDAIEVIDPETGRFLDVNETGCTSLGYTREELLNLGVPDIESIFPDRQSWTDAVNAVRDSGRKVVEGWHRRKDGTTYPVEVTVTYTHLNRGYLLAVVRDITARKLAEQRSAAVHAVTKDLAEAPVLEVGCERVLRSLGETLKWKWAALWLVDPRASLLRFQGAWHEPTNDYSQFEGLNRATTFAPGVGMPGQVWATGTYQHLPTMTADHAFPRTNFASHFGRVSALWVPIALDSQVVGVLEVFHPYLPQPDPELIGTLYGICGQIGQFVERKHLEHQFRQAQKMEAIGQLAGGVAHDFNNLLTIINGYSELIYGKLPVESPLRDLIAEVQKAGERATALTRQLLVFSRKQVLQPQIVGINRVIEGLTKILRRLIGEDVMLSFSPGADLAPVKVDPGYLEQTLINLAVNARDAMPDGGCLTLETRNVELDAAYALEHHDVQPGRYVLVAVTDTGHGMEEGVRNRIFEPFFTTKEPGKGTGLGLSMVFGFVRQSGGHIQVYSEAGRGTTFKLYLPQSDKGGTPSLSSRLQTSTVGGNETILLVEDEERIRSVSAVILRAAGYTVLEAAHGLEALEVAQRYEGPIHLMVTDVVMPNMGGRPLANKMAETRPETKVLYVSGYTDDAIIRHGVLEEGIHFLHKPFSATALAVKVREVLDGTRIGPAAEDDVPTISP